MRVTRSRETVGVIFNKMGLLHSKDSFTILIGILRPGVAMELPVL